MKALFLVDDMTNHKDVADWDEDKYIGETCNEYLIHPNTVLDPDIRQN